MRRLGLALVLSTVASVPAVWAVTQTQTDTGKDTSNKDAKKAENVRIIRQQQQQLDPRLTQIVRGLTTEADGQDVEQRAIAAAVTAMLQVAHQLPATVSNNREGLKQLAQRLGPALDRLAPPPAKKPTDAVGNGGTASETPAATPGGGGGAPTATDPRKAFIDRVVEVAAAATKQWAVVQAQAQGTANGGTGALTSNPAGTAQQGTQGTTAGGVAGAGGLAGADGTGGSGGSGPSGEPAPVDPAVVIAQYGLSNNPRNGRIHEALAEHYFRNGDWTGSYASANDAMSAGRINAGNHVLRGLAAERLGDYEHAHRDAAVALELDPANNPARSLFHLTDGKTSTVHLAEANAPWQAGAEAAAQEAARGADSAFLGGPDAEAVIHQIQREAGNDQPRAASNFLRAAHTSFDLKDFPSAIALASKAIEAKPKNPDAFHIRAISESRLGRYSDAAKDASASLGMLTSQQGFPVLKTRAAAYNGMRRYEDALKDALQAKSIKPGDGFVLMSEARALGGLGRRDEMIERLREAAAVEPAKYQPLYEGALDLPSDADTEALFTGLPASARAAGAPRPKGGARWHWLRLALYCLAGGLLIALGLSHREVAERATTTARRLLTGGTTAVDGEASASVAASAPGANFWARYESPREIAKGGMGVVYEATDRSLGRRVAVKKMREELRSDPRERERFLKEARTVAGLQHPNIVQIFEIAEDGLDAYLVFEFVDGETLHDRRKRLKRMSWPDPMRAIKGICEAVEYAHGHGLTHRDLKPSNVMMDSEGRVKVMDFGIARQAKDALTKLSMTNTVCGTPPYMAPEQEQGMVCKESDIYSLGVVAYELLSGSLPFEGAPGAMLLAKMSGRYDALSSRVSDLPPGADAVIARALHPDPSVRYRRPSEFAAALEALTPAVRA